MRYDKSYFSLIICRKYHIAEMNIFASRFRRIVFHIMYLLDAYRFAIQTVYSCSHLTGILEITKKSADHCLLRLAFVAYNVVLFPTRLNK